MKAIVVGGGIGGLSAAYRLMRLRPDADIELREAGPRLGGVIRSERIDGCLFEHGPDSIVTAKPAGMALVRELGLEHRVIGTRPEARRAFVARDGRLLPVPEGLYLMAPGRIGPFLRSPLMSWPGKLRMALDWFIPARPAGAPEESLAQFVRRRLGHEALARIAQPMIAGISTGDPERLSLASVMPQFVEMERTHGSLIRALRSQPRQGGGTSGPRYGLFASFDEGLQVLVDALVAGVADRVRLRTGSPVALLERTADGWRVDGDACDAVVLALPARAAAPLIAPTDAALAKLLGGVSYAGVATVNLVFPAEGFPVPDCAGFVVPADQGRDLIAATNVGCKYPGRAAPGLAMLRAFVGGALRPDALTRTDDQLLRRTLDDLRWCLPGLGSPLRSAIHRWPAAMAQHEVGHRARTAEVRRRQAALPGMHLVGNGYEGVGIPDLIAMGDAAARAVAAVTAPANPTTTTAAAG